MLAGLRFLCDERKSDVCMRERRVGRDRKIDIKLWRVLTQSANFKSKVRQMKKEERAARGGNLARSEARCLESLCGH